MNPSADHFKQDATGRYYAGDHLLVELWGAVNLTDAAHIERALGEAARVAGATVLHAYYHPFGEGQGVSGVTVLAESHISIHTWPERQYAAIDIFMCGDCDPRHALPVLERAFEPSRLETRTLKRGIAGDVAVRDVA